MKKKLLTVFNYNLHKGLNLQNTACVMDNIKSLLDDLSPDIVLLQEVQGGGSKLIRTIPDRVQAPHHDFLAGKNWEHFVYGKNAVYSRGHHGNAILSKFPILKSVNFNITTNLFEKRGVLYACIHPPHVSHKIHIFCTHLNLKKSGRKIQLEKLSRIIESHTKPGDMMILGGDFNDYGVTVSSYLEKLGFKDSYKEINGRRGRTFPSALRLFPLDRIYFQGLEPKHADVLSSRAWKKLSDHLPIVASFELNHP